MAEIPTIGELYKAKFITNEELGRAVEAVLAGAATDAHPLADGYVIDLVSAVENHPAARGGLAADGVSVACRRNLAGTAILLARPEKV